jgi:hypothetical protein
LRAVTVAELRQRLLGGFWKRLRGALGLPEPGAPLPDTPRVQLLALSELVRRIEGDVPGSGRELDLVRHELRVFSQNGEDGVLAEMIRRSGAPGRYFVEFGAADGVQNNCAFLADVLRWNGLFMDGGEREYEGLAHRYAGRPEVTTAKAMVTPENIQGLLAAHGVPAEPDVLSIDVDGSDYWIWEAITDYRPRIVVIEYNGSLEPGRRLVQPRDTGAWLQTDFIGASIEALVALGERKGYRLVHCEMTGNNAFFLRDDLPGDYLPAHEVPRRRWNFWLAGARHVPDRERRSYLDLDASTTNSSAS